MAEPDDVLAYRRMHPDFPHDPTADQFFTESQFESYRALGHHAVLTTLNQLLGANEPVCVGDVIEVLRNLDRLPH